MNFNVLVGLFSVLVSSISAISILNFPLNLRVQPGSDLQIQLADNQLSAGDHVRVELWDNQDDEDVNAAVLGEDLIVNSDNTVDLIIPSQFPKTNNAFLRVYYKHQNTVSPRFSIKPMKNCMTTKTPCKPTATPTATPIIIHHPTMTATAQPVVIIAGGSGSGPAAHITGTPSVTSAVRPTSSAKHSTMSSSTSTSSASVAKFSAGSIAAAIVVAVAMLF